MQDVAINTGDSLSEPIPSIEFATTDCASTLPLSSNGNHLNSLHTTNLSMPNTSPSPGSSSLPRPTMPPKYSSTPQMGEYSLRIGPRTNRVTPTSSDNRLPVQFNDTAENTCASNTEASGVAHSCCARADCRKSW